MSTDPRAALVQLVAALERHLDACAEREDEDDPRVIAAYDTLADAMETYDEALFDAYDENTPFEVDSADSDDDSDDSDDDDADNDSDGDDSDDDDTDDDDEADFEGHDDEDGDSDLIYSGLDDEFDIEDNPRS